MSTRKRKRILLTGGRAPVTLDLARMFDQFDYEVYVADSFSKQLTKSSKAVKRAYTISKPATNFTAFVNDLVQIIKKENINLLIPTCEEVFYIAKGKSILEQYCSVFCPDLSVLLPLHHKYEFIKKVEEKGLLAPPSLMVRRKEELSNVLDQFDGEVVVKPVFSRFGTEVLFINKYSLPNVHLPVGEYVVQKRINGKPICSYSIFHEGNLVAHTQYEVVFSAGNSAAIYFQPLSHSKVEQWVKTFFASEKVTGQFAFDFIETKEGNIYPLECNPRSTSGIHLFSELPLPHCFFGDVKATLYPLPNIERMIGLAMLLYGWRKGNWKQWWKTFLQAKDVIWSRKDPTPFFYQFVSYFAIFLLSFRIKKSPIATTTYDIEWNGDEE